MANLNIEDHPEIKFNCVFISLLFFGVGFVGFVPCLCHSVFNFLAWKSREKQHFNLIKVIEQLIFNTGRVIGN